MFRTARSPFDSSERARGTAKNERIVPLIERSNERASNEGLTRPGEGWQTDATYRHVMTTTCNPKPTTPPPPRRPRVRPSDLFERTLRSFDMLNEAVKAFMRRVSLHVTLNAIPDFLKVDRLSHVEMESIDATTLHAVLWCQSAFNASH